MITSTNIHYGADLKTRPSPEAESGCPPAGPELGLAEAIDNAFICSIAPRVPPPEHLPFGGLDVNLGDQHNSLSELT